MIAQFEDLLNALGKIFSLPLQIDRKSACSIQIHPGLILQMQLDPSQENLWIFAKLIELPPGKFRENTLKEALKTNAQPDLRPLVLCYLNATNHLCGFQKYPLHILTGERLAALLGAFVEMAQSWQEAIQQGRSSPPEVKQTAAVRNPFGLQ